jgi:ankyrin repeat protein
MSSSGYSHSSDLSQSVISLSRRSDLIGYRNVLSYASALVIPIFPESAINLHHEPIGQGSRSATLRGILHEPGEDRTVAVKQPNTAFTRDKAEEEERIQHLGLSSIIQEIRILADPKLRSHPNLPHVIGAFSSLKRLQRAFVPVSSSSWPLLTSRRFCVPPNSPTQKRDNLLKRITLGRNFDFDPFDTGAMGLSSLKRNALYKSAFNDNLETFIELSQEALLKSGSERIHYYAGLAVSNGSVRVSSYLADHFQEGPNESWEGTTHLEGSIMFGRSEIARIYFDRGAELVPSNAEQPSILHYQIRHEDIDLAKLVCAKLEGQGDLAGILNWKPAGGVFAGKNPLRIAVSTRTWKISSLYIELGADINLETSDGPIFQSILKPQSPYPPVDLLYSVLDRGADPNAVTEDDHPALEWPVFTSNVLAVRKRLLHGAQPVLSEEYN